MDRGRRLVCEEANGEMLEILPSDIRTGVAITANWHGTGQAAPLRVVPRNVPGAQEFNVPWQYLGKGEASSQFTLVLAGRYALSVGDESREIQVAQQKNLSFGQEFGFFSFFVFILVGGMLVWLRRIKKNR